MDKAHQGLVTRVEQQRHDLTTIINGVKEDFKGRIEDLDKYYSESLEEISNNLESVKIMARDSV